MLGNRRKLHHWRSIWTELDRDRMDIGSRKVVSGIVVSTGTERRIMILAGGFEPLAMLSVSALGRNNRVRSSLSKGSSVCYLLNSSVIYYLAHGISAALSWTIGYPIGSVRYGCDCICGLHEAFHSEPSES